jgi:hypothetical protein
LRMLAFRPTALMLVLLALSSCAYSPGSGGFPWEINFSGFACKDDSSQILEGVDWNQAKVLDVRIRQSHFSPTYLGLYMAQPYVLNIENADDVEHSFMAFDFFRAVAVAGVSAGGTDFKKIKCLAGVAIPPRTKTAFRFVAVRDGTYEFEDDSIVNSLAMIGSGGGFITIEPRRRVIERPLKHLELFDYKPFVIGTEEVKADEPDGRSDSVLNPNSSFRELSKDPKNTSLDKPPRTFEVPEPQQPIGRISSQPASIPPLSDTPPSDEILDAPIEKTVAKQESETSKVLENEPENKVFVEKMPVVKEVPLASDKGLTQSVVPEAMLRGYQLFEGPPADVYSDPPDDVKKIPRDSVGPSGDGGEDKLDSSG